jgi:hypothetical protein
VTLSFTSTPISLEVVVVRYFVVNYTATYDVDHHASIRPAASNDDVINWSPVQVDDDVTRCLLNAERLPP